METRGVILGAAGAVVILGAVGAAYYYGSKNGPQPQLPGPSQTAPEQNAAAEPPTAPAQQAPESAAQQQAAAPAPRSKQYVEESAPWPNQTRPHRSRQVDFRYFRDSLAPYGRWQFDDRWGRVWQPSNANADFRPYQDGHWAYTDEFGWTWVSDTRWGDIAFHYGRWVEDPDRGWLWVPGYVWGPGWVIWRTGAGHAGWMPMPPDQSFLRRDESYRSDWSGSRSDDYGYRRWYGNRFDQDRAAARWVYVDLGHLTDPDYRRYAVRRPDQVRQLNAQTRDVTHFTMANNYVVDRSVDPQAVARQTGRPMRASTPGAAIRDPQLVAPVPQGRAAAVESRQAIPAGQGMPHTAPPLNPQALNAAAGPGPAMTARPNAVPPTATVAPPPDQHTVRHDRPTRETAAPALNRPVLLPAKPGEKATSTTAPAQPKKPAPVRTGKPSGVPAAHLNGGNPKQPEAKTTNTASTNVPAAAGAHDKPPAGPQRHKPKPGDRDRQKTDQPNQ